MFQESQNSSFGKVKLKQVSGSRKEAAGVKFMVLTFRVGERAWFPKACPQQQQKSVRAGQSPALAGLMADVSPIRHLERLMLEKDKITLLSHEIRK